MCSLENVSSESVTCLAFADSYMRKSGESQASQVFVVRKRTVSVSIATPQPDPSAQVPTLWVGTSLGSVLTVAIQLPEADDRKTQPVLVTIMGTCTNRWRYWLFGLCVGFVVVPRPGGTIFRSKGSILSLAFLDCSGALIPYSYETWRGEGRAGASGGGTGMCEISRLLGALWLL